MDERRTDKACTQHIHVSGDRSRADEDASHPPGYSSFAREKYHHNLKIRDILMWKN